MTIDISAAPFNLTEEQQGWVYSTLERLSVDEKIGQIFCASTYALSKGVIETMTDEFKVGGLMIRPLALKNLQRDISALQRRSAIPMLIAANLEKGGDGAIDEGTYFANPMGCAATGDPECAYRLGKVANREGAAVGVNWSFAPIVDIDRNFRNPITNIRTYGDDPARVLKFSREFIRAATEEGVTCTIKHFPGDGVDERDQHLLVSVNDLSQGEWEKSYGMVYRELISDGAKALMVGHIAQPALARAVDPDAPASDAYLPASQSPLIMSGYLRKEMGYNGLIVTDSTLMVGYMQSMPRRVAVPHSVACGADMILFNKSLAEDFTYMKQGIADGILPIERLDEAVTRVLALKASMGLVEKQRENTLVPRGDAQAVINSSETRTWARDVADRAVTLVKDPKNVLPLSPHKTPRVYLNVLETHVSNNSPFAQDMKARLEREGFKVTLRRRKVTFNVADGVRGIARPSFVRIMREVYSDTHSFISKYDLALVVLNMETESNNTVVRINWQVFFGLGHDIPWYAGEMPLVAVSFANPYHLIDLPMAHAYVNAYSNNEVTRDAVFEKLMGRSEFKGANPIDPFCGHIDCGM